MSNSSVCPWSEHVLPLLPLGASEEEEDQENEEEEEENRQSTVELPVATAAAGVPTFGQSVA